MSLDGKFSFRDINVDEIGVFDIEVVFSIVSISVSGIVFQSFRSCGIRHDRLRRGYCICHPQ